MTLNAATLQITPEILSFIDEPMLSMVATRRRLDRRSGAIRPIARHAPLNSSISATRVMLAALPELSVLILEAAREHGPVTVAEAVRISGASRNTIKVHMKALVDQGHLVLHGAGRGAWYGLS